MSNCLNMKNNLIQNFYIIGLSLEDIIDINKEENKLSFTKIFINLPHVPINVAL